MKLKILQKSKTIVPIDTGNLNNLSAGLTIKNKNSFVVIFAGENGDTPIYVPSSPPIETEVTNFTFYDHFPFSSLEFSYVGARCGFAGCDFTVNNAGGGGYLSIFEPIITTNTGATLDTYYTVYHEEQEIWMNGQTFGTVNKGIENAQYGNNFWTVSGVHPELSNTIDASSNTLYYSNVLQNSILNNYTILALDIRPIKFKYEADYPSTWQNTENVGSIYIPLLDNWFKNVNTTWVKRAYGTLFGDIGNYSNYQIPQHRLTNNFLIQIKDKFFVWTDTTDYQKQNSDIPDFLTGSGWDLNTSTDSGFQEPRRTRVLWQKNSQLGGACDYCHGPMPDGTTLDISFTGNVYWTGNSLYFDVSASGTDRDCIYGVEPVNEGLEGFPWPKYDFLYYDWAVFSIDPVTKNMTKFAALWNQAGEIFWENLQNTVFGLPDQSYSQYIQPGMKLALLCRVSCYKRSIQIYVNVLGDVQDFHSAFYGGMNPTSGCWDGSFNFVNETGDPDPIWEFAPLSSIKSNWAWCYITVPEKGTASQQNPLSISSIHINNEN